MVNAAFCSTQALLFDLTKEFCNSDAWVLIESDLSYVATGWANIYVSTRTGEQSKVREVSTTGRELITTMMGILSRVRGSHSYLP